MGAKPQLAANEQIGLEIEIEKGEKIEKKLQSKHSKYKWIKRGGFITGSLFNTSMGVLISFKVHWDIENNGVQ